jgi:hypothetical protein
MAPKVEGAISQQSYLITSSVAGLIAGASGVIVGHPLDTIKVEQN